MSPLEFYGSKVVKIFQVFVDEIYKVLEIMGVSFLEMAELAAYKLKGVAQV